MKYQFNVKAYLDDYLIGGESAEEVSIIIKLLSTILKNHNAKMNIKKLLFTLSKSIHALGFTISSTIQILNY